MESAANSGDGCAGESKWHRCRGRTRHGPLRSSPGKTHAGNSPANHLLAECSEAGDLQTLHSLVVALEKAAENDASNLALIEENDYYDHNKRPGASGERV
jgi:hypothetical protein